MIFLIKSQNKLKLISAANEKVLTSRLNKCNPDFQIVTCYPGSQYDAKLLNAKLNTKDGWFDYDPNSIDLIEQTIKSTEEQLREQFDEKKNKFYKKINKHVQDWMFKPYDFKTYTKIHNLNLDLNRIENFWECTNDPILQEIKEVYQCLGNLWKINSAKRFCKTTEELQITPSVFAKVEREVIVPEEIVLSKITINDQMFCEKRYYKDFDFDF